MPAAGGLGRWRVSYAAPHDRERAAIDWIDGVTVDDGSEDDEVGQLVDEILAELRGAGHYRLECERPASPDSAAVLCRWIMNELCEPVTASIVDGAVLFTREWAKRRST